MIDMHSHILYDVDDGCKSIQDSIAIIRKMKKIGFDKIVLTPHYIKGSNYVCDNDTKKQRLNLINQLLKENEIDVELILGNEDYIFTGFSKDTRTINSGDTYVGIKGENFEGNNF